MSKQDAPRLCRVAGRDAWHIYHKRKRVSTGCQDRAGAEKVLATYLKQQSAAVPDTGLTISDMLIRYLADREDEAVPGLERLRWAHKPLKRIWGEKPPEAITDVSCRSYARQRAKDGVVAGTIRTELQALRAALNWSTKKGMIAEAPSVKMPAKPPSRDRWLNRAEAEALLAACKAPHVRLFIHIALHTAARKGAILGLQWHKIDMERRVIDFTTSSTQTRKRRTKVPINETLLAALQEADRVRTTDWVIEYGGGQIASIKHAFADSCQRAGISGVTPHTLRHTAATWMAQAAVPLWEIAGFLGHSSIQMVQDTYGHHHPDHLQRAAQALG